MSEPIITCPHCKAEVRLTKSLAAPLIQATRKKIAEREREVARRESAIQANAPNSLEPLNWPSNSSPANSRLSERSQQRGRKRLSFQSLKVNHRKLPT